MNDASTAGQARRIEESASSAPESSGSALAWSAAPRTPRDRVRARHSRDGRVGPQLRDDLANRATRRRTRSNRCMRSRQAWLDWLATLDCG